MTNISRAQQQVQAAMTAVETAAATQAEKAEMLMEIAMGLQQKPERAEDIFAAVDLYKLAMDLAPEGEVLGVARIRARMATALMAVPAEDATQLKEAKSEIEIALATLTAEGSDAEVAEAEMNLGLICQTLADPTCHQRLSAVAQDLRQDQLPQGIRGPAKQPGHGVPVHAVHRPVREDARGAGSAGL